MLAGLLAEAGYWAGEATAKKSDYDTYENQALVELNRRLLTDVNYSGHYELVFRAEEISQIAAASREVDPAPYQAFIEHCNQHRPWVWKDPRLWLTIRFWCRYLNAEDVQFIWLAREEFQAWVSLTIRRQIQTYAYLRHYLSGIQDSVMEFFDDHRLSHFDMVYEDLLVRPEETICRLSAFLEVDVTMEHLRRIYKGRLYRKQRGYMDAIKAYMIYCKNFHERYRSLQT